MRRSVGLLLAAALVASPLPAYAETTINGGTPEQRAIVLDASSWDALPTLSRRWSVTFAEISPLNGYAGCSGVVLDDDLTGDELLWTFLHEYGHVWDCHYLTQTDRIMLMRCSDGRCDTEAPFGYGWRSGTYTERPIEQFAWSFAHTVMRRHQGLRASGPNPAFGGYMWLHMTARFISYRSWCHEEVCIPG